MVVGEGGTGSGSMFFSNCTPTSLFQGVALVPGVIKPLEVAATGKADSSGLKLLSDKASPTAGSAVQTASTSGGLNGMMVAAVVVLLLAIVLGAVVSR